VEDVLLRDGGGDDLSEQEQQPITTPNMKQESMNPPVLPWHSAAAKEILDAHLFGNGIQDAAAIIAAHDPHAAQHQETVRLLEEALAYVAECAEQDYAGAPELRDEIRAHLAAQRGEGGAT
jgi:hypothetical protein